MQYITKLATSQSQKPRDPLPQLYQQRHPCGLLKFLLGQNAQPCKIPVNIYLYLHLPIFVSPKAIQVYIYMEMKIFENTFPPYEDLQTLFTFHVTPHTTLGNVQCLKLLLGVCNTKERGDLSISLAVSYCQLNLMHCKKNWSENKLLFRIPISPTVFSISVVQNLCTSPLSFFKITQEGKKNLTLLMETSSIPWPKNISVVFV